MFIVGIGLLLLRPSDGLTKAAEGVLSAIVLLVVVIGGIQANGAAKRVA
jgi:hypothetical protein